MDPTVVARGMESPRARVHGGVIAVLELQTGEGASLAPGVVTASMGCPSEFL